jgi:hypothetical protein
VTARGRFLLRLILATGALGALIFGAGVTAALLAGGIPFHDGPNAGFASPPGIRRAIEHLAGPLLGVGALLLLATAGMLALAFAFRRRG